MAAQLIFITGATGFIGSATALAALEAGYRLRISVRKPSTMLENLFAEYHRQIEYVVIPDITNEAAFDGSVLDGVDYVMHLASPLAHGTDKETYFAPAVKGTTAVLKAAAKVASIKKVIVTSSIAALIPTGGIPTGGVIKEDNDWDFHVDESASFEDPENPSATPMRLYQASKLLANNATWEFRETARPHYALVTLHPAFVYGHNLTQKTAEEVKGSSNVLLWGAIMTGVPAGQPTGVHIQDVAEAHIKVLDPKIPDGSRYLLSGNGTTWADVAKIAQREYPAVGAKITTSVQGESYPTDTRKAETDLQIQWRSWDRMVGDVMDQQLRLIGVRGD